MKPINILIICYDFQPLNTVGAHRIDSWAKNLFKHGIKPTIVSRKWNIEIKNADDYYQDEMGEPEQLNFDTHIEVRIPFKMTFWEKLNQWATKNNLIWLRKLVTFLLTFLKWLPKLTIEKSLYLKDLPKHLNVSEYKLIIASGEPFLLFKYAHELAKEHRVPWVADYRDTFTTRHFGPQGLLQRFIYKWEGLFERKYYDSCLFYTTVSQFYVSQLEQAFGKKKHVVVENGIDLDVYKEIDATPLPFFNIAYAGSVYDNHNVTAFLEGYEQFILLYPNDKILLQMAGISFYKTDNLLRLEAFQKKYPNHLVILPRIPKKDSIKLQKQATALLKFSMAAMVSGQYGAKLYEYVACNKPIINVVSDKKYAKTDLFEEKNIQQFASTKEEVFQLLNKMYTSFKNNEKPRVFLNEDELFTISREHKTKILAQAIKECLISD